MSGVRIAQARLRRAALSLCMRAAVVSVVSVVSVASLLPVATAAAQADTAIVHIVRPGETLASIADTYYGDPGRENVLVAENGLTSEGGSSIVVGLRLVVPTVTFHRVSEGETWAQLAKKFYGEPRRAFALIDINGASPGVQPDVGSELLVPYPLRHVAGQNQTLRHVAKAYLGEGGLATIRRFNSKRGIRLQRGEILLVPLVDLKLSERGRELATAAGAAPPSGDVRAKQARINEQLPTLRAHVRHGRYTETVAQANRLIGDGDLTGNQVVTVQRELGTALVALGREELARVAFGAMLERQPDVELDLARTSPKVKRVFADARRERSGAGPDGAPDAGVADADAADAADATAADKQGATKKASAKRTGKAKSKKRKSKKRRSKKRKK